MHTYIYRNLPCTASPEDWCIWGKDTLNGGVGVLEWCSDSEDALRMFATMKQYPQFTYLSVMRFNRPDSRIAGLC